MSAPDVSAWLGEQLKLVEQGGRAPHALVLEGPDQRPWGTWPIALDDLVLRVQEAQRKLEGTMPAGKHSARWIALDDQGQQFACLPTVITGRSQEASAAAKDVAAFSRATSQHLQATEHLVTLQQNLLQRFSEREEETATALYELKEMLSDIVVGKAEQEREHEKFLNGEARLDKFMTEISPILGAAANIAAEKIVRWSNEQPKKPKRKRSRRLPAKPQADGQSPPPPVVPAGASVGGRSKVRRTAGSAGGKSRSGRANAVGGRPAKRVKK